MKRIAALLLSLALLAGCGASAPSKPPAPPSAPESSPAAESLPSEGQAPGISGETGGGRALPVENAWIAALADEIAAPVLARGLSPDGEIREAYLWLIGNVYFADPVGLDSWRYHGDDPDSPPPYLENRALSPLAYGIGSCEDFAAAMTVLLRRMGYPAEYVSGLTISVDGEFVDHAWTVVRLEGRWYHLDPQLEQNVARSGRVAFRYFLKDDRTMLADHRWGENLAAYWGGAITPAQRELLLTGLAAPACAEPFLPVPDPARVKLPARPDIGAVQRELDGARERYLLTHDEPGPPELDITPPIYAAMPEA